MSSFGRLARSGQSLNASSVKSLQVQGLFGSANASRTICSSNSLILKQFPTPSKQPLLLPLQSRQFWADPRTLMDPAISFRFRRRRAFNFGIRFVPHQEAFVIERFGKFSRVLEPGLHFLKPIVEKIAYRHSLKEHTIIIPEQPAVTTDNVSIQVNGVLFVSVIDPVKASYGNDNAMVAVTQLAQTVMRSVIGKMPLDKTFMERETLNANIVEAINRVATQWGLTCRRYEIRDIIPPHGIKQSMEMQAEAERKKRAEIIEAEGRRQAIILTAEAAKTDVILKSEAAKMDEINRATGEAEAIKIRGKGTAEAINIVSEALQKNGGQQAASLKVAEEYVQAFSNLAQKSTTMLLPAAVGDPSSMAATALGIYKTLIHDDKPKSD